MTRRILLVALLTLGTALAQGRGGGGGGGRGGMNIPAGSFGPVNKADRITEMLKLSKDQKKELRQTFDEAQKEATPLHEPLNKARLAIGEAVAEGKSPEEIGTAVKAEAALESQMTLIELKAFAKFVAELDQEQQAKASGLYGMMRGIFSNKNWNSE